MSLDSERLARHTEKPEQELHLCAQQGSGDSGRRVRREEVRAIHPAEEERRSTISFRASKAAWCVETPYDATGKLPRFSR